MKYILALDQSTSATKAVLFDESGHAVDKSSRDHRQIYPQPGWVEHNAEEIWQNVLSVLGEVIRNQSTKVPDIVGLSITNQRETFVVFDRATGQPRANAIVWQCRRGSPVCDELRAADCETTIRQKTGLKLDTYFSASKLRWLIDNDAEIRSQLESGDALFGTIDTYLIYRLTGGAVFATDHTNASRTLLFDIRDLRWDGSLCEMFHVPVDALAEVRESAAEFGKTDAQGLLPEPIPICGVMGDSQASLFAQRCFQPGMGKATFGSGTSVLFNVGDNHTCDSDAVVTALAWVINGQPTYALEGLINYSSATIAWMKDQLELIDDPAESESLACLVEDNGGVYFVPAFAGLSAPYWNPDARAAIVGITAHTTKAHVVRAALESIAYQINDVLTVMRTSAGVSPSVVFADGGPTQNRFLMQFTADLANVELVVADVADSSALGAALAGLLGLGLVDSLDSIATLPRSTHGYQPRMESKQRESKLLSWDAAVQRVL